MNTAYDNNKEITPQYWVAMTDKFMSGWGHAKNKTNKLVLSCRDYKEAEIVEQNARDRDEMIYINICTRKPYYNQKYYYTSYHGEHDYGTWYRSDRPFRKEH